MDWFTNICNCFSPQLRKNIIGYLSSANINRQVLQQQKCSEQISQKDQQSIYVHAKARSYYNIQAQDIQNSSSFGSKQDNNQIEFQNQLDPQWYPKESLSYDQIFLFKLKALKQILQKQIDQNYQKVYDSQDQNKLIIYSKNQLQKGKKMNVYKFQFSVPTLDTPSLPQHYYSLQTVDPSGKSLIESLLKNRQILKKTQKDLQICYRTYQKKLVISQHDFITAQKTLSQQQLDQDLSNQNHQVYNNNVYTVIFSVKQVKDQKSVLFQRGHINLLGLKAYLAFKDIHKQSNKQIDIYKNPKQLKFQGYINIQLDTNVSANMLKQPAAKQIRIFVQKLISLLQNSDAI